MTTLSEFCHKLSPHSRNAENDVLRAFYGRQANNRSFKLREHEVWWRNHAASIKKDGYRLRPRFRPNWKPVWLNKDLNPHMFEDAYVHQIENVIDAQRLEDGRIIALKRTRRLSNEITIAKMLSSESSRARSDNHCVPIFDHFLDRVDPRWDYLVMPLLRKFDSPDLYAASEIADFVRQTLEGLAYMHSMGVAHRNLTESHIMMEGDTLFPNGFHPSRQELSQDCTTDAVSIRRIDARPVRYYFIDFSQAAVVEHAPDNKIATDESKNPFPLDVYNLGQVYKTAFIDRYRNVDFLPPVVEVMMRDSASLRPSAENACRIFDNSTAILSTSDWRLALREERLVTRVYKDLGFALSRRFTRSSTK